MTSRVSWFSTRKRLMMEIAELRVQLENTRVNYELLSNNIARWRRRSDLMDLLGDEALFEKLAEYGSLESILTRVSDYERIQTSNKLLERRNRKLETEIEELEKGE